MPPKRFAKGAEDAPMKKRKYEKTIFRKKRGSLIRRNVESNFVDTGQFNVPCDVAGSVALVNVIPQNATVNGRVGKRVALKSLQIHGFFFPNIGGVINNCMAMIVLDRQSNGAALPAITDIMVSANANDFANDAKNKRYKILRRYDCVLSGTTGAVAPCTDCPTANWNDYIKLNNFVMEWNTSAATGVQATIEKGAIYLVTVGTSAAGVTAATLQGYIRVRYTEDF